MSETILAAWIQALGARHDEDGYSDESAMHYAINLTRQTMEEWDALADTSPASQERDELVSLAEVRRGLMGLVGEVQADAFLARLRSGSGVQVNPYRNSWTGEAATRPSGGEGAPEPDGWIPAEDCDRWMEGMVSFYGTVLCGTPSDDRQYVPVYFGTPGPDREREAEALEAAVSLMADREAEIRAEAIRETVATARRIAWEFHGSPTLDEALASLSPTDEKHVQRIPGQPITVDKEESDAP